MAMKADQKAKKTTLHLPPTLTRRLLDWKRAERRTTADAVMSAYIGHRDTVESQFAVTDEDQLRISYGLAPLAATRPTASEIAGDGTRVVGLYINPRALKDLDTSAAKLGLSRSKYATELLDKFLPGDEVAT